MRGALGRLRWQLTLSHLVATAFTLVSLIAAAVLFATFVVGVRDSPRREPAQDAQTVARAIGSLEAQLQASQTYTRSLIESNIDALMTTDPVGVITDVNEQMATLTGRSRQYDSRHRRPHPGQRPGPGRPRRRGRLEPGPDRRPPHARR